MTSPGLWKYCAQLILLVPFNFRHEEVSIYLPRDRRIYRVISLIEKEKYFRTILRYSYFFMKTNVVGTCKNHLTEANLTDLTEANLTDAHIVCFNSNFEVVSQNLSSFNLS